MLVVASCLAWPAPAPAYLSSHIQFVPLFPCSVPVPPHRRRRDRPLWGETWHGCGRDCARHTPPVRAAAPSLPVPTPRSSWKRGGHLACSHSGGKHGAPPTHRATGMGSGTHSCVSHTRVEDQRQAACRPATHRGRLDRPHLTSSRRPPPGSEPGRPRATPPGACASALRAPVRGGVGKRGGEGEGERERGKGRGEEGEGERGEGGGGGRSPWSVAPCFFFLVSVSGGSWGSWLVRSGGVSGACVSEIEERKNAHSPLGG